MKGTQAEIIVRHCQYEREALTGPRNANPWHGSAVTRPGNPDIFMQRYSVNLNADVSTITRLLVWTRKAYDGRSLYTKRANSYCVHSILKCFPASRKWIRNVHVVQRTYVMHIIESLCVLATSTAPMLRISGKFSENIRETLDCLEVGLHERESDYKYSSWLKYYCRGISIAQLEVSITVYVRSYGSRCHELLQSR